MRLKKPHISPGSWLLAVASGCLLTLIFPKSHLWMLSFFALVPLMVTIHGKTARESFFLGFAAGVIHFCSLIYWLVPTLHQYGGLHPVLATIILCLLSAYLALYPAVFAFLCRKSNFGPAWFPIMAACLWVSLEYIRTYAFSGFAWGLIGYSQSDNRVLIQSADLTGVYGISFLIVLINALIAVSWTAWRENRLSQCRIPAVYTTVLIMSALLYGQHALDTIEKKIHAAEKTLVGIVQGNIAQDKKWSPAFKARTVEKYCSLSLSVNDRRPDLIVWPETALPFYFGMEKELSERVISCIQSSDTAFLIGAPAVETQFQPVRFYNRAYLFKPSGMISGTYEKHHLVPFGEYVPFGRYLNFLGKIIAQAGDFTAGTTGFVPLDFSGHKTGVLICFEILFPGIAADFVHNGADILTTLTNDAWFGRTSAARQHFSISVFRAVETRRSLVRAANTGISGFIDPSGAVHHTTPLFTDAAIVGQLPALKYVTPYSRYKDLFVWLAMVAFSLGFMVKRLNKTPKEKTR